MQIESERLKKLTYKSKEIDEFLYSLFINSRPDLIHLTSFDDELSKNLLRAQYELSEKYIDEKDLDSRYLITYDNRLVGNLYMRYGSDFDELVSIALLPNFRNLGIGREVIESVIYNSELSKKYVKLRVAWYNAPAKRLYEKIGFVETFDYEVYCEMENRYK